VNQNNLDFSRVLAFMDQFGDATPRVSPCGSGHVADLRLDHRTWRKAHLK
jgi:hypothetical protein